MRGHRIAGPVVEAAGALVLIAAASALPAPLPAGDLQPRAVLRGHTDAVLALAFSPNGTTLASGGGIEDESVRLWDLATGRTVGTLTGPGKEREDRFFSDGLAFSPDGKVLAGANPWGNVCLWDVGARTARVLLDGWRQWPRPVLALSPDGKTVACGSICEPKLWRWDVATGKRKDPIAVNGEQEPNNGVLALAYLPDGKSLITVGWEDEIRLWDDATGKNMATVRVKQITATAAISPDRKTVATVILTGGDIPFRGVTFWDAAAGEARVTVTDHPADVWTLAFAPDGKTLAAGCEDGTIKLWEATTGKDLGTLKGHTGRVYSLAFSPDGQTLASGGADKTINLWDVPPAK